MVSYDYQHFLVYKYLPLNLQINQLLPHMRQMWGKAEYKS